MSQPGHGDRCISVVAHSLSSGAHSRFDARVRKDGLISYTATRIGTRPVQRTKGVIVGGGRRWEEEVVTWRFSG